MVMIVSAPSSSGVGQRLLRILRARSISLSELARMTERRGQKVSLSQLSLLTRGEIDQPRLSTLRAICAALGIATDALLGDLALTEGVTDINQRHWSPTSLVSVVLCMSDGGFIETGETVGVSSTLVEGRQRTLAAVVEGGGMGPAILIGDRVVFDPDEVPTHGKVALLLYGQATICAWLVEAHGEARYRLADGTALRVDQVKLMGTVVYVMRSPPEYLP